MSNATRRSVYAILIAVATAMMLARVMRIDSPDPKSPTPFLSANDRSRWATIRALADDGTYAIDHIIFDARGNRVRGWHTIDLVRHRGRDGEEHYYSSKPTLLTTLLAGEYWLIKRITGATLAKQPHYVSRLMLVLTNVLPLAVALGLLVRMIEEYGEREWGQVFAVAAACFGTFMTTFAVTLNNHVTAAISLVIALAVSLPILRGESRAWWRFAAAGLALGFLAANELPALSLLALAGMGLAWLSPIRTLLTFGPAALLVAAGAFGTNYLAHGHWKTPYAHRQNGPIIATLPSNDMMVQLLDSGNVRESLIETLRVNGVAVSEPRIERRELGEQWRLWDQSTRTDLVLQRAPQAIEVRRWDHWYDYPGSYWIKGRLRGIDVGEPSAGVYAFNVLIGHHGLFSLTPIWLLSAAGCVIWLLRGDFSRRALATTTIVITVVVVGFYLTRPQIDRNYGGGTCCLRWLIWLTPLWLLTMLPAVDWLSKNWWGRSAAIALLMVSVFSAFYAADNPWTHPWIFDYWTAMGWIEY